MITWESIIAQSLHLVQWHTHTGRSLDGQMLTATSVGPGTFPAGAYTFAPLSSIYLNGSPLYIDSAAPATSAYLQFLVNGTTQGYIGAVGAASNLANFSLPGDMAYRTQGGRHVWSADSGASLAAALSTSGVSSTLQILSTLGGTKGMLSLHGVGDGNAAYIGWYNTAGIRIAYMGYGSANLSLVMEAGSVFKLSGHMQTTGGIWTGGVTAGVNGNLRGWTFSIPGVPAGGSYWDIAPDEWSLLAISENTSFGMQTLLQIEAAWAGVRAIFSSQNGGATWLFNASASGSLCVYWQTGTTIRFENRMGAAVYLRVLQLF